MSNAAHTPTPWTSARQDDDSGDIYWAVHSSHQYEFITNVHSGAADAAFIVRAVNAHDGLVAAADIFLNVTGNVCGIEPQRKALIAALKSAGVE